MPREDGTNSAISVAREESTAAIACIEEANAYCKERARRAVFLTEQTEYQGVLTERGRGIARVISKIPGVGDEITSDEDYRVTARFKCVPLEQSPELGGLQ